MKDYRAAKLWAGLGLAACLGAGCTSPWATIAPDNKAATRPVGAAQGVAHGQLVSPGIGTAYYFWPVKLNSRMERAYGAAVASAPNATGLEQVTLQESWYWWVFGTGRKVTITGTGVAP